MDEEEKRLGASSARMLTKKGVTLQSYRDLAADDVRPSAEQIAGVRARVAEAGAARYASEWLATLSSTAGFALSRNDLDALRATIVRAIGYGAQSE